MRTLLKYIFIIKDIHKELDDKPIGENETVEKKTTHKSFKSTRIYQLFIERKNQNIVKLRRLM